jgi:hypothetical protein
MTVGTCHGSGACSVAEQTCVEARDERTTVLMVRNAYAHAIDPRCGRHWG